MMNTVKVPLTRKVAVLAGNGFTDELPFVLTQLQQAGVITEIVSAKLGVIQGRTSGELEVQHSLLGADSVLFDAVLVAGGASSVSELLTEQKVLDFIKEAYQHFKPIAAIAEGAKLLSSASGDGIVIADEGEDLKPFGEAFIEAIAAHRHWTRVI